jgi:quercetin dioxygenase-like cupin family protein
MEVVTKFIILKRNGTTLLHYSRMAMKVEHWDADRDGKLSTHALRHKLEELGYSVSSYTYAPGTYFPTHTHPVDKIDAVLSGRFRISMGNDSVELRPGDCIYVPRGAAHSAEVVGDEPVVSLDAVKIHG